MRLPGRVAAFALTALLAGGCGTAASTPPAASRVPSSAVPAASCMAAPVVEEAANGSTMRLCVGQTLLLKLHNTHWERIASSDEGVLRQTGSPSVTLASPGTCVPGAGCGTISASFDAVATGEATLSAHRTSCGEVVQCPPDQQAFTVTVIVS